MKIITEDIIRELESDYRIVYKENGIEVFGTYDDITYEIIHTEGRYIISRSSVKMSCGDENDCFDRMADNKSEAKECPYTSRCVGPRLFEYMPKIYVASTFKPDIRFMNRYLKEEIHRYGMFPVLPQHLSQDNPERRLPGGKIAQDPSKTREEIGDIVGKWCEQMIEECEGCVTVLNGMGNDASWECGLIRGLRKPAIAVYYNDPVKDPLNSLRNDWMVRRTEFIDIIKFPEDIGNGLLELRNDIYHRA